MQTLICLNDPVSVQIAQDALEESGIVCRVDNAGMHALMPLPAVMDMRIFVDEADLQRAKQVLADLGLGEAHD